jgi:hypothetical protein
MAPLRVQEPWPAEGELGPNDLELQSVCSLISSGTELKVRGVLRVLLALIACLLHTS